MKTIISITFFLILGIVFAQAQGRLSITQPLAGATVSQMGNTINITVSGGVPAGQCIVVFIKDPTGQWWPYTDVARIATTNVWQVQNVQYGNSTTGGRPFAIQAIQFNQNNVNTALNIRGTTVFVSDNYPISTPNYSVILGTYSVNHSPVINVTR